MIYANCEITCNFYAFQESISPPVNRLAQKCIHSKFILLGIALKMAKDQSTWGVLPSPKQSKWCLGENPYKNRFHGWTRRNLCFYRYLPYAYHFSSLNNRSPIRRSIHRFILRVFIFHHRIFNLKELDSPTVYTWWQWRHLWGECWRWLLNSYPSAWRASWNPPASQLNENNSVCVGVSLVQCPHRL